MVKKILREVSVLLLYLFALFVVAYSNNDPRSFEYSNNLRRIFIASKEYERVS